MEYRLSILFLKAVHFLRAVHISNSPCPTVHIQDSKDTPHRRTYQGLLNAPVNTSVS